MPLRPKVVEELLHAQLGEQEANLKELREAIASLDFFRQTLAALQEGSQPGARSCSICLEDDLPLTRFAITPCAHTFCIGCLSVTTEKFKSCSICRQPLDLKDIR